MHQSTKSSTARAAVGGRAREHAQLHRPRALRMVLAVRRLRERRTSWRASGPLSSEPLYLVVAQAIGGPALRPVRSRETRRLPALDRVRECKAVRGSLSFAAMTRAEGARLVAMTLAAIRSGRWVRPRAVRPAAGADCRRPARRDAGGVVVLGSVAPQSGRPRRARSAAAPARRQRDPMQSSRHTSTPARPRRGGR